MDTGHLKLASSVGCVERRKDFNSTGLSPVPRQKGICFLVPPVRALPEVTLQQCHAFPSTLKFWVGSWLGSVQTLLHALRDSHFFEIPGPRNQSVGDKPFKKTRVGARPLTQDTVGCTRQRFRLGRAQAAPSPNAFPWGQYCLECGILGTVSRGSNTHRQDTELWSSGGCLQALVVSKNAPRNLRLTQTGPWAHKDPLAHPRRPLVWLPLCPARPA